jgi:hypothetical protein
MALADVVSLLANINNVVVNVRDMADRIVDFEKDMRVLPRYIKITTNAINPRIHAMEKAFHVKIFAARPPKLHITAAINIRSDPSRCFIDCFLILALCMLFYTNHK